MLSTAHDIRPDHRRMKKHEQRVTLESLDDIYKHADALKTTVKTYLNGQQPTKEA